MSDQITLFPLVEFSIHMRRWWVKIRGAVTVDTVLTKQCHFGNTTHASLPPADLVIRKWHEGFKKTYGTTCQSSCLPLLSAARNLKQHLTPEWCTNGLMSLGSGTTTGCTQTVSRICSTLWLKLQCKCPKHLMQPGIIYNYLSILKAEQLALIEGKDLWVVAGTWWCFSGLGLSRSHFSGATIQLRG